MGVYLGVMTDQVVHHGNPNYVCLTQRVVGLMFWCGSRLRQRWLFRFCAFSSEPVDGF